MVEYDPFSEEVMRDPAPIYKRMRDEAPAYYNEKWDCWALSRFADIWKASADTKHFTATKGTTSAHLLTKVQPATPMINLMDPPQHSKMRSSFRNYFGAPQVAGLEPMIREMAVDALAAAKDRGRIDAMLEDRQRARGAKDWAEADRIRDALADEGIEIVDTPEGARWRRK